MTERIGAAGKVEGHQAAVRFCDAAAGVDWSAGRGDGVGVKPRGSGAPTSPASSTRAGRYRHGTPRWRQFETMWEEAMPSRLAILPAPPMASISLLWACMG